MAGMSKLQEIKSLIDSQEVGDIWETNEDGTVNIRDNPLTPLGRFIIKLERIIDRDDDLIKQLMSRL